MFIVNQPVDIFIYIGIHSTNNLELSTLETEKYITLDLKHLNKIFHEQNSYPHLPITTNVMKQVKNNNAPCEQLHEEN